MTIHAQAPSRHWARTAIMACTLGASVTVLSGCFPLAATGVVVGALSVSDRRTTGAQAEDQAIELKAQSRFRERLRSDRVSLTVVSFNRIALVTGYVPDEATRAEAARIVGGIENVRSVLNEVVVGPVGSITTYGSDTLLTTRVKASLVDAKDLHSQAIKVFTEAGSVFLMGIVTEREAARAADIASRVSGVRRVIRAFEVVSEAELARIEAQIKDKPAAETAPAPVSAPAPTPAPAPSPAPVTTSPIR
jgi:osmotically-inducible protein OsmY